MLSRAPSAAASRFLPRLPLIQLSGASSFLPSLGAFEGFSLLSRRKSPITRKRGNADSDRARRRGRFEVGLPKLAGNRVGRAPAVLDYFAYLRREISGIRSAGTAKSFSGRAGRLRAGYYRGLRHTHVRACVGLLYDLLRCTHVISLKKVPAGTKLS